MRHVFIFIFFFLFCSLQGGTSEQANEYRLYKKQHPLHEAPYDSDGSNEHSTYFIAPLDTSKKKKKKKKNKKTKQQSPQNTITSHHRRGSISLLTSVVSKIPVEHRRLHVCVHGCQGLPAMDVMGKADAFVMITVGRKSVKTKIMKATLNPNYEQHFDFGDDNKQRKHSLFHRKGNKEKNEEKVGLTNVDSLLFVVKVSCLFSMQFCYLIYVMTLCI